MSRRLKIALFSPVNPQPCGVSDYTEDLLPSLVRLADIDLVIDSYRPSNHELLRPFRVIGVEQFRARAAEYDTCVYQIANSFRYHGYVVPVLAEFPGIVVLHDVSLQYVMLGLSVAQGDLHLLERFLSPAYGNQAAPLARKLFLSRVDPYEVSMIRPILEWATGIIVHSQFVHTKVLAEIQGREKDVRYMPMAVPISEAPAARGPRERYGFSEDEFIIASVSTLSYTKRLELALEAVYRLRPRFPALRLLIIGAGSAGVKARDLINRYGLEQNVIQTGRVSARQYRDYIAIADAVVDLRYPSGTEASASLSRGIAVGKPVLVSAHGWFLSLPDEFAVKIPVDDNGLDILVPALAELITNKDKREAMGRAAWEFAREHFGLDDCAARYIDFIEEVISRRGSPTAAASRAWQSPGRLKRLVVGSMYNALRLPRLARSYGLSDTLAKIRQELAGRRKAEAGL